jgi:hypothetical protein
MKYFILLLCFNTLLLAGDFRKPSQDIQYKAIDDKFTMDCNCGSPAILLPYNGEDIPLAKTVPCPYNGCQIKL